MPASGINQGIQPIIGNNYGSKNYSRVIQTLFQAAIFSVSITCFIWLIVLFFRNRYSLHLVEQKKCSISELRD
ncbi:MAG: hypothetical protein HFI23_06020 [Lachnospiraceae bacterium]|nr:hypothetical protein [Lachnospiraceae bacterium]